MTLAPLEHGSWTDFRGSSWENQHTPNTGPVGQAALRHHARLGIPALPSHSESHSLLGQHTDQV